MPSKEEILLNIIYHTGDYPSEETMDLMVINESSSITTPREARECVMDLGWTPAAEGTVMPLRTGHGISYLSGSVYAHAADTINAYRREINIRARQVRVWQKDHRDNSWFLYYVAALMGCDKPKTQLQTVVSLLGIPFIGGE